MTDGMDLFIKEIDALLVNSESVIHTKISVSKALVDNNASLISYL